MTMQIGTLQLKNPFFLAPMEAVNCASFRLLCKQRGAGLVYTDMIDADIFMEYVLTHSPKEAITKFINPQPKEQPLAIQIGGSKIEPLLQTIAIVQPHAALIDFNIGCPLSYMLGKKGGVYLMKHPDQLYKLITEMRKAITIPFTVKMRSGWDENTINAVDVCIELEKLGVDAVTIHGRTRKQGYRDRADWPLVRQVKEVLSIPVILSGDVTNTYMAYMAFSHTKCDFIMIGRGAQNNPSFFTQLKKWDNTQPPKPTTTYNKTKDVAIQDLKEFIHLYKTVEKRYSFSELQDHSIWLSKDLPNSPVIRQKILKAKTEQELIDAFFKKPSERSFHSKYKQIKKRN